MDFGILHKHEVSILTKESEKYGGLWTVEKLDILKDYLNAYTTALKNKFNLIYIDAFAGNGEFSPRIEQGLNLEDANKLYDGSVKIALAVDNKPFDRLVFIERDSTRYEELKRIELAHSQRNIEVLKADANEYLQRLDRLSSEIRGVIFLDPFATEVEWASINAIARVQAFDTWMLFPTHAILRVMKRKIPAAEFEANEWKTLDRVFGTREWKSLYHKEQSDDMLGSRQVYFVRSEGHSEVLKFFKKRLTTAFGARVLQQSRTLYNRNKSALFEFIFCVGKPTGITVAKRIANSILKSKKK